MRVKIITHNFDNYFEDRINEFIKDKVIIDIKFILDNNYNKALIMYEE